MAKFKPYTIDKEIDGVNYIAQFNGIGANLKAIDSCYIDNSSNTSLEKLADYIFTHVIVDPKISIDDFGKEKIGEVESKVINGTTYKAEFKGIRTAVKIIDDSYIEGTSNTSLDKLSTYLLDEIIVSPKNLATDDFESMEEFNEVVSFAREVMQGHEVMDEFNRVVEFGRSVMDGNFRDKKDNKSTKEASK